MMCTVTASSMHHRGASDVDKCRPVVFYWIVFVSLDKCVVPCFLRRMQKLCFCVDVFCIKFEAGLNLQGATEGYRHMSFGVYIYVYIHTCCESYDTRATTSQPIASKVSHVVDQLLFGSSLRWRNAGAFSDSIQLQRVTYLRRALGHSRVIAMVFHSERNIGYRIASKASSLSCLAFDIESSHAIAVGHALWHRSFPRAATMEHYVPIPRHPFRRPLVQSLNRSSGLLTGGRSGALPRRRLVRHRLLTARPRTHPHNTRS